MVRQHSHKFTIADDDAVRTLVDKLVNAGPRDLHREKLLRALDDAARHYKDSHRKVRQAFFHGFQIGLRHEDGRGAKPAAHIRDCGAAFGLFLHALERAGIQELIRFAA